MQCALILLNASSPILIGLNFHRLSSAFIAVLMLSSAAGMQAYYLL